MTAIPKRPAHYHREMSLDECVFCELLSGRREVTWVARRAGASAFLPLADGRLSEAHVLVIPDEHVVGIEDASPQNLQSVILLAQEIARSMKSSIGASGVNILNASGEDADQSVPHLHLHVVPRWRGDGLDTWPSTISQHALEDQWLGLLRTSLTPDHPRQSSRASQSRGAPRDSIVSGSDVGKSRSRVVRRAAQSLSGSNDGSR